MTDKPSRFAGYRRDYFLMVCSAIAIALLAVALLGLVPMDSALGRAAHTVHEMLAVMWWGIVLAIVVIGILDQIPQEFIVALLGKPGTSRGILRAAVAGVLLDLCSHGILMVGAKLYQRGASAGQVMAFLIASPWNSISLTFILFGLLGAAWTLSFIALSLVIAISTGFAFDALERRRLIPSNAAPMELPADFRFFAEVDKGIRSVSWSPGMLIEIVLNGLRGSRIVLRWLVFGLIAAAVLRGFFTAEDFATWFGPSLVGLLLTLLGAAVFEVCSEGSVPIAADLMNRAAAPGNSFTFLLAGVASDYTEVMVLRETTSSTRIALLLPLITIPQVLVIGWILNNL
ncbi:MAG: permease [Gammaproteobacteria bacterium]|nr:permease [Gammaproteobacteria bacterium]